MSSWDSEPLEDDDEPAPRRLRSGIMRVVVLVAVIALVLPGVLVTWTTQVRTANYACQIAADYYAPGASHAIARLTFDNPDLIGWNCYAVMFNGEEVFTAHLGLIPGAPRLVPLTGS